MDFLLLCGLCGVAPSLLHAGMFTREVNIRPMANSRQPEADPRWLMQLGEAAAAAEQAGDLPAAAAAYRDMAEAMPRDPALMQRLGVVEYLLGNLDDAIARLSAAARMDPWRVSPLMGPSP